MAKDPNLLGSLWKTIKAAVWESPELTEDQQLMIDRHRYGNPLSHILPLHDREIHNLQHEVKQLREIMESLDAKVNLLTSHQDTIRKVSMVYEAARNEFMKDLKSSEEINLDPSKNCGINPKKLLKEKKKKMLKEIRGK